MLRWCLVLAESSDVVTGLLPILAANTLRMHYNSLVTDGLGDLQDQKSLTLCWHSFSESGRECIAFSFAYQGSVSIIYECLHTITTQVNHDTRPNIVDDPLTPIFRMGQGACRFLFCL